MSISDAATLGAGPVGAVRAVVAPTRAAPTATLVSSRVIANEAVLVAVVVAGVAALVAPRDLGFGLAPHPGWVAVVLLSARYGSRGFGFAFAAVSGALTLAALALRLDLGLLVTAANNSVPDLGALAVSVLVAWIASAHERRIRDLTAHAAGLETKDVDHGATISELRDAAVALRARADRMDHSLTFIRDVSARLESGDAVVSASAALELALARTGARAGVVQLVERGRLRTVASLGDWTSQAARPPEFFVDRTIATAFAKAAPTRAVDLADAGRDDSDVATPIADHDGNVLGVLALRGVPSDSLCHALVHDLGIVAHWCAKASAARQGVPTPPTPAERDRPAPPRAEDTSRVPSQQLN
jgi:hypothetical protein